MVICAGVALGACGGALWFWDARQSVGSNSDRKHWAKSQGYSYSRKNQHLPQHWDFTHNERHGAARDVVSGTVRGVDFSIADIGEETFVGIRRGATSNVIVQAIRANAFDAIESDLQRVLYTSGFAVVSNDSGAAERFVDERVDAALEALEEADHIWLEGEWVVARVTDEMASLEPLTLLADAARALPPAETLPLELAGGDATRPLPQPLEQLDDPEPEPEAVAAPESQPEPEPDPDPEPEPEPEPRFEPKPMRPPVDLPSRTVAESRGELPAHMVGGDAVDSIGDRGYRPADDELISPKVARDLSRGSSIFDDLSDELGITVDGKHKGEKNG